jgi:hypothetical protein
MIKLYQNVPPETEVTPYPDSVVGLLVKSANEPEKSVGLLDRSVYEPENKLGLPVRSA